MPERAVTYVRVSTEEEKQLNALAKQREEAKQAVKDNGWIFIKEYIDEGKTGTSTKMRDAYNQLFHDLATDAFDIVVIKSQDRLMRNPKDWYIFLSEMLEHDKRLYMYMDEVFYKSDDSLITGIKAILAAEYSRDLSKKLNLSNKRRQEQGSSIITCGKMLGYIQKDGELYIHEEEAKVVRRIAELYEQNIGARAVKKALDKEGWVNRFGKPVSLTTIKRFPNNYAYEGTIIQNKAHKDFDTKQVRPNDQSEWFIHENRCPVIIPHERMERIRGMMQKRVSKTFCTPRGANRGSYPLSSKIICSECGKNYRRITRKDNGELVPFWICGTYQELGRKHPKGKAPKEEGCDGRSLRESTIYDVLRQISDERAMDMAQYANTIITALRKIHSQSDPQKQINAAQQKLTAVNDTQNLLLDKFLEGIITEDVFKRKNQEIETKKQTLQDEIETLRNSQRDTATLEERYEKLFDVITSPKVESESKFRFILDCVENIKVFPDHMDIVLKVYDKEETLHVPNTRQERTHTELDAFKIKLNLSERFNMPYEARVYLQ